MHGPVVVIGSLLVLLTATSTTTTTEAAPSPLIEGDYRKFYVAEEMPANTIVCDLVLELGLRSKYDPEVVEQLRFR